MLASGAQRSFSDRSMLSQAISSGVSFHPVAQARRSERIWQSSSCSDRAFTLDGGYSFGDGLELEFRVVRGLVTLSGQNSGSRASMCSAVYAMRKATSPPRLSRRRRHGMMPTLWAEAGLAVAGSCCLQARLRAVWEAGLALGWPAPRIILVAFRSRQRGYPHWLQRSARGRAARRFRHRSRQGDAFGSQGISLAGPQRSAI